MGDHSGNDLSLIAADPGGLTALIFELPLKRSFRSALKTCLTHRTSRTDALGGINPQAAARASSSSESIQSTQARACIAVVS